MEDTHAKPCPMGISSTWGFPQYVLLRSEVSFGSCFSARNAKTVAGAMNIAKKAVEALQV